jgi:hypothetical protein
LRRIHFPVGAVCTIAQFSLGTFMLALAGCGNSAPSITAEPMNADDIRRELVNLPLCGMPKTGPLAGKPVCTIHFGDGTATLAGDLKVSRILWDIQGRAICRRDAAGGGGGEQNCVTYDRLSNGHYRNSDGVDFCIGPCQEPAH